MFIPMLLNKYKPDVNSLGLRVRTLVINDFKYIPKLITNGENTPNYENKKSLFNATFEYINKLSDIQKNKSLL